ncbi:MAG: bifunctional hydroxymethylpyrimidine kinase/phosphomethylpyrimidine kinase [Candidatus Methylacidiphilales bacterium]|nr:bifunctional hydroxymethylpyrimidine kinase/phosphomethylpyrimidine kinase [Candidatus Methylacidiphilales bacterium]
MPNRRIPVTLTIAGSDNSGGAGLQADLKTFTTLGTYGTTAVTCVVAEHPGRVTRIDPLPPEAVSEQIRLVFEAFPVAGAKTGMLYSGAIMRAVAGALAALPPRRRPPLVVDPVLVASSGALLFKPAAVRAMQALIFPLAALVTPNLDEAGVLTGKKLTSLADVEGAAEWLARRFGVPFLVKGGHLRLSRAVDVLHDGRRLRHYSVATVAGVSPHGTGCTYSAAIAAGLAHGLPLEEAVAGGKRFITTAIRRHLKLGSYPCLNHLPGVHG